jgi:hypothetical protein
MLIQLIMETLLNLVDPFFTRYEWRLQKNASAGNICYKNKNPYDEFVIALLPRTHEISVIVPVDSVPYKQTFQTMATAVDYIQMHLNYYHKRISV